MTEGKVADLFHRLPNEPGRRCSWPFRPDARTNQRIIPLPTLTKAPSEQHLHIELQPRLHWLGRRMAFSAAQMEKELKQNNNSSNDNKSRRWFIGLATRQLNRRERNASDGSYRLLLCLRGRGGGSIELRFLKQFLKWHRLNSKSRTAFRRLTLSIFARPIYRRTVR